MRTIDEIKAGIANLVKEAYQQGIQDAKDGEVAFDDGFDADVYDQISGIFGNEDEYRKQVEDDYMAHMDIYCP